MLCKCCENCYRCSTSFFTIPFESLDLCENTRTCLDPQLKDYGSVAFTLIYLSAEIRVNEAQSTDTTLVHKHEQQMIKIKHNSKGRENENTR